MPLRLFYITNSIKNATIAQDAGVDTIFVDLEIIGKPQRQGHLNTVISRHTTDDVSALRKVLNKSSLLVRVNPIHPGSKDEIDRVISAGADIVMLPMFSTAHEAEEFISLVSARAETCLLVETPGAVDNIGAILKIPGIDSIHIGLNDLHIAYGMHFMFELLADGTVERLTKQIGAHGIRYGFGGIACLGHGLLTSEVIIIEHYRLQSSQTILSRSFCNMDQNSATFASSFANEVSKIRVFEEQVQHYTQLQFQQNQAIAHDLVAEIANNY